MRSVIGVLACLTSLVIASPAAADDKGVQRTIERCERQMAGHGEALVKACVDQDLEAEAALVALRGEHPAAVARCERLMAGHGQSMVKACVEQDIAAAAALAAYPPNAKAVISRCASSMSGHGAAIVKACADRDLRARGELDRMRR